MISKYFFEIFKPGIEKWIIDFSFLMQPKHDSQVAWQLFNRFKLRDLIVLADKGYYWFDLFNLLKAKNLSLVVPPKNYGPNRHSTKRLIRLKFHKTYENNKELYSLRNNVESVFSSLKRVQGLKIRSRIGFMKKREMGWQILWYNIRKKLSLLIILLQRIIKIQRNPLRFLKSPISKLQTFGKKLQFLDKAFFSINI